MKAQPGFLKETEVPTKEKAVDAAEDLVVSVHCFTGDRVGRKRVEVVRDGADAWETATGPSACLVPLKSGERPMALGGLTCPLGNGAE